MVQARYHLQHATFLQEGRVQAIRCTHGKRCCLDDSGIGEVAVAGVRLLWLVEYVRNAQLELATLDELIVHAPVVMSSVVR